MLLVSQLPGSWQRQPSAVHAGNMGSCLAAPSRTTLDCQPALSRHPSLLALQRCTQQMLAAPQQPEADLRAQLVCA